MLQIIIKEMKQHSKLIEWIHYMSLARRIFT